MRGAVEIYTMCTFEANTQTVHIFAVMVPGKMLDADVVENINKGECHSGLRVELFRLADSLVTTSLLAFPNERQSKKGSFPFSLKDRGTSQGIISTPPLRIRPH